MPYVNSTLTRDRKSIEISPRADGGGGIKIEPNLSTNTSSLTPLPVRRPQGPCTFVPSYSLIYSGERRIT